MHPILAIRSARKRRSHRSARLRIGRGPRLRGGRRSTRCQRATRRRHHAFLCSIPGRTRFPSRFYEARRPLLWSMRNCGKNAPGDTSRRYPICVSFRNGTEKVGSGRRDLVTQPLSPRRISSIWQSHIIVLADALSIGGGLVRKQAMNVYFTFDRLYREIRAVRSGLRTVGGCRSSCGRAARRARRPTSGSES